ncbi:MAG: hypothetical protein R3B60_04220 [Candidatus Paceibacterota bacterium]
MWKVYTLFTLMVSPILVSAAGLVPCGGDGADPCQTCHVVKLIQNIFDWLGIILGVLIIIMIMVLGLWLASSVGQAGARTQIKKYLINAIVGYIIFLAVWFVVDFGLKVMVNSPTYDFWDDIQCVAQPTAQQFARTTATGSNNHIFNTNEINSAVNAINSSGSIQTDIQNTAVANGINDPYQQKIFKSLIMQESGNCTNKVGPDTPYGTAYGCSQMLVSTARGLDPSLKGLSDEEVATKLRDDNNYSLALGAKYYDQLYEKHRAYDNATSRALAEYNGGPAAILPSNDCPGLMRWECAWDSPGCYETENSSCVPNTGYVETRNYVKNITSVADAL